MATSETVIRWIEPLRLAESWVPGHHAPHYDAIDRKLAEAGDRACRLGDLVTIVPSEPAADTSALPRWLVRRSGGELLIEPASAPGDGQHLSPLPERAVLVSSMIARGAEAAYWGEDLYQGGGALVLARSALFPEMFVLEGRDPSLDLAWLTGELRGEFVQAQVARRAEGAGLLPRQFAADLLALWIIVPPAPERARLARRVRRRAAALADLDIPVEDGAFLATGATFEERLGQVEEHILRLPWVDARAAYFIEAAGPDPFTSSFLLRRLAPQRANQALDADRPAARLAQDAHSLEMWRRWFWNTEWRCFVFNHLDDGHYLPTEIFQSHVRNVGPPPVPVEFIPAFEEWRECVLAQQDLDEGLGPGSWPEMLRRWLRSAGLPGSELSGLDGGNQLDSTGPLARWLRSLYRPALALKVLRDRRVVGVVLLFGPDQVDDPDRTRVLLEEQGGILLELLSRAADAGDDVARRESLRRLSTVMHSLNGPIGRVVSALDDIERFLATRPDIGNEVVLDPEAARQRDAVAARLVELRQRRAGRTASADGSPPGEHGCADTMSPGEQSTLSARLQVAVRNIRLLQKTSEQIKLLRRVHNQLEQAPVELAALLLQAAGACRDEIPHLRLDVSGLRSPLWVHANEESVRLAVNEVLANACRELRYRQIAAPEIRVLAEVETDVVVLRIRDNGLPIDTPLIDHPFEEDASAYARLNLGTGFGLTFVRETFRMHDGSCSLAENRDEQRRRLEGVTFEARLPYRPTEERGT